MQQQINLQQLQYPLHFKSVRSTIKSTFRILSNHEPYVSFCHQNCRFFHPFFPPRDPPCPHCALETPSQSGVQISARKSLKVSQTWQSVTFEGWKLWELSSGKQLPAWILVHHLVQREEYVICCFKPICKWYTKSGFATQRPFDFLNCVLYMYRTYYYYYMLPITDPNEDQFVHFVGDFGLFLWDPLGRIDNDPSKSFLFFVKISK